MIIMIVVLVCERIVNSSFSIQFKTIIIVWIFQSGVINLTDRTYAIFLYVCDPGAQNQS